MAPRTKKHRPFRAQTLFDHPAVRARPDGQASEGAGGEASEQRAAGHGSSPTCRDFLFIVRRFEAILVQNADLERRAGPRYFWAFSKAQRLNLLEERGGNYTRLIYDNIIYYIRLESAIVYYNLLH